MNKNLLLYVLLVFLIVVNGFFLFKYIGNSGNDMQEERKTSDNFLVNELDFDAEQKAKFEILDEQHHQSMQGINMVIRGLKDEMFKELSNPTLKGVNRDSIAALIGEQEAAKDIEVFRFFSELQELCNDKQREKFSEIIKGALRRGGPGQAPPPGVRPNAGRPMHHKGEKGNRPPPPPKH